MYQRKYFQFESNESNILKSIIDNNEISRTDLAKENNLNKTTTSTIVNKLIENHLVYEASLGNASSVGGRKPVLLRFNEDAASAISVEIATDYVHAMLTNLMGGKLNSKSIEFKPTNDLETITFVASVIQSLLDNAPESPLGLIGISVAVHGTVIDNDMTFSPFYTLDTIQLKKALEHEFNCHVFVENEANLAALGEFSFATLNENIININIKNGIGAGIIKDGQLLTGQKGRIGEIGHSILFPDGKPCPCGNKGCLERYASMDALVNSIRDAKQQPELKREEIISGWKNSDKYISSEIKLNAKWLSISINNLVSFYDPDEIIINCRLYSELPELVYLINASLTSRITKDIKLTVSNLREKATLYGGVSLVISTYLNINNLKLNTDY